MELRNTILTEKGKDFIRKICQGDGNSLISGKKPYPFPFSNEVYHNITWTANAKDQNNNDITTNKELGNALIYWFEKYGKEYNLDPNIIAAQAYVESEYKIWHYAQRNTKSGISGLKTSTIFKYGIANETTVTPKISIAENAKLKNGLDTPDSQSSYEPEKNVSGIDKEIAINNRPILHQNIIDNPEILIKLQCRIMKHFAENSKRLASVCLFSYIRGAEFLSNTYTRTIEISKNKKNNVDLHNNALDYVKNIFLVLERNFGYDLGMTDEFDVYRANVAESEEYGILERNIENLPLLISNANYRLLSFTRYHAESVSPKKQIVLHHTVSGPSVAGDVYYWESTEDRVSTAFIVDREGMIFQLYNSEFWGNHIGATVAFLESRGIQNSRNQNRILDRHSVGIELDSWGGLKFHNNQWYPANHIGKNQPSNLIPVPAENVIVYSSPFRGFDAFEKYTPKQIESTRILIRALQDKYNNIPLFYNEDMWDVNNDALNGIDGIWTHVSYREDKSDCHPQPELIDMLKDL